jgi:hypothetical protein
MSTEGIDAWQGEKPYENFVDGAVPHFRKAMMLYRKIKSRKRRNHQSLSMNAGERMEHGI